jgi:NAD(P)-dependent dehydrogenase (short-subunit alcohol dehydrogenase family)
MGDKGWAESASHRIDFDVDLELAGKFALVTGGSRGIGKAIARRRADEGVDVAIVARGKEALEAAAEQIAESTGRRVVPVVADTANESSVTDMVRSVLNSFGRIDILVNSAADPGGSVSPPPGLAQVTDQTFFYDMNVKVMGYLRCAREVAPGMRSNGWGRIVNIGGMAGRRSGNLLSASRNAALVAATKNLADELGPHGINVTIVHPSMTRTERTPRLIAERARREGVSDDEMERRMAAQNSVRRFIDADDIAFVVTMLCSPKAVAINGDVIAAGGGSERSIFY